MYTKSVSLHYCSGCPATPPHTWSIELRDTIVGQSGIHLGGGEGPDEDVPWFDVSVNHVHGVEVANAISDLAGRGGWGVKYFYAHTCAHTHTHTHTHTPERAADEPHPSPAPEGTVPGGP